MWTHTDLHRWWLCSPSQQKCKRAMGTDGVILLTTTVKHFDPFFQRNTLVLQLYCRLSASELRQAMTMPTESHGDAITGDAISVPQHPIQRIPLEIKGEIFRAYMAIPRPPELDNMSEHSRDSYVLSSPYVLCLVCTSWRAVAINHPILWSNVAISSRWDSVNDTYIVKENHGRALREWVGRIRDHAWSLDLSVARKSRADLSLYTPLPDILPSTALVNLEFLKTWGSLFKDPTKLGCTSFPKLKSLVTDGYNASVRPPVCPELEKVTISLKPDRDLPFQQLTHLYIGDMANLSLDDFVFVLTVGVRLRYLCIWTYHSSLSSPLPRFVTSNSQTQENRPSVNLTDLTLINASPFENPLPAISWPNLKRLRLFADEDDSAGLAGWHHTNIRLLQSLTHLHLPVQNLLLTPGLVLDACPLLTHLCVEVFDVPAPYIGLFRLLTHYSEVQTLLLPCLQSLKIDCRTGFSHFPHDWLHTMVASRLALSPNTGLPRTPLKNLTLRTPPKFRILVDRTFPDKLREGLEKFRSQVEVSVVTARHEDYEVQMSHADVDHWDRGFGEFIDKFGEF